jgi:HPt (histidine-containing phosphotransfer) domain-containing protein
MASTRQRWDSEGFQQVCEELRDAANAFGRLRTADALGSLIESMAGGDEAEIDRKFEEFELAAMNELRSDYIDQNQENEQDTRTNQEDSMAKTEVTTSHSSPVQKIHSRLPMDEPEFREIVVEFVPTLEAKIGQMKEAYANNDFDQQAKLAHWLKGAGGTVGFDEFYQPSIDLETAAKN